jgi:hypothetical protein
MRLLRGRALPPLEGGRVDVPQAMTFDDALAGLGCGPVVEIGCGQDPVAQAGVGIDVDLRALCGMRSGVCRIAGDAHALPLALQRCTRWWYGACCIIPAIFRPCFARHARCFAQEGYFWFWTAVRAASRTSAI